MNAPGNPRLWTTERRMGVIVLIVSLVAVVVTAWTGHRSESYRRCETRVIDQLVAAQQERARATEERDTAWDEFVDSSLSAKTPEEKKAALDRWLVARQRLKDARRDHPLPDPPRERCG